MDKAQAAQHTFHIARHAKVGRPTYAFDLRRTDNGGLAISNVKLAPDDIERQALYAHFGKPLVSRSGFTNAEGATETVITTKPGTAEHFLAAVHRLPLPFCLVPSAEK